MSECMVCGHVAGACKGEQGEAITVSGVVKRTGPLRMPQQRTRFGVAGYKGNVEVYDPRYPNLRMVRPDPTAHALEDTADATGETRPAVEPVAPEKPARTKKPAAKKGDE